MKLVANSNWNELNESLRVVDHDSLENRSLVYNVTQTATAPPAVKVNVMIRSRFVQFAVRE